jgi:hypothetical protein
MKEFDAFQLARLLDFIARADSAAHLHILKSADGIYERVSEEFKKTYSINPIIVLSKTMAEELRLESTLNRVCDNGPFTMRVHVGLTWPELRSELQVLQQSIEADLEKRWFFFVPADDVKRLQDSAKLWTAIFAEIPDCKPDAAEAIDCLMFDRHTACVFHCMRAAEYGLRYLAKKTKTTRALRHKQRRQPIELADWTAIMTAINNKIATLRSRARISLKHSERLALYSDAADHCGYMKDIWRNRMAHARKPYDKTEAVRCLGRVEGFMHFAVTELSQ